MNTTTETPTGATASAAPFHLTAGEHAPVVVALSMADPTETLTLGGGFPTERNGKPCRYWDKEAIGPGVIRDAKGAVHRLTTQDVDDIVEDVTKAMSFGHEPSLPDRHFGTPGRNYGWVKAIRKNDKGNVVLTHQHVGEPENNDALNHKTSVMLRRNFTDERGRQWRWWLDHNAVIHNPQLRDLEDFKPSTLAASSDGQPAEVDYVVLAADHPTAAPPQESPAMIDLTKLRAALGDRAKDKPDDDVIAMAADLSATAIALSAAADGLRGVFDPTATEGKSAADVIALAGENTKSLFAALATMERERDDAITLSDTTPAAETHEHSPAELALGAKAARSDIKVALSDSVITVGQAEWLRKQLDGDGSLALAADFNQPSRVDEFIAFAAAGSDRPVAEREVEPAVTAKEAIARGITPATRGKADLALSADPNDPDNDVNGGSPDDEAELAKERDRWGIKPLAK